MHHPELTTTEDVSFVPILQASPETQERVRQIRNSDAVREKMYSGHIIAPDEHEKWLKSLSTTDSTHVWVVFFKSSPCGVVSLNCIDRTHRTASWAFYLSPEFQGKGLGALVEFALLDHAFNNLKIQKLNCEVLANNSGVVRLHKKFGFQVEGNRRENIVKSGSRLDVTLLGILPNEWQDRRPRMRSFVEKVSRSLG